MTISSTAEEAPQAKVTVSGTATLIRGSGHPRPCDKVFLVPSERVADLGGAMGDKIQMDWSFYRRLGELRQAAIAAASCRQDGSFELSGSVGQRAYVVAHFSWLRGKWSTGGSLIRQVDVPLISPLNLHVHLDG